MKFHYLILLALVIGFASCKYDNFSAPGSMLTGKLTYNGEAINLEFNQVNMQVWQPGFGKLASINLLVAPDGSFSAKVFDGNYKLVFAPNQGPFQTKTIDATVKDTIMVPVKGNTTLNVEVVPYWLVRNAAFTNAAGVITGTCKLDKIITDASAKTIERATLYINKTDFVSGANYIVKTDITGANITDVANVSLKATVPTLMPTQAYVFARIGLKLTGVDKLVFSPVVKVTL